MVAYMEMTKLHDENVSLAAQNKTLRSELETLKAELKWLKEKIGLGLKQKYGPSSEQSRYDFGQLSLLDDAESLTNHEDVSRSEEKTTIIKQHIRKTRLTTDKLPPGLPIEIIEHTLPEEKQICPDCGDALRPIGKEDMRDEIKIIPAQTIHVKHVRVSYGCRTCEKGAEKPVIIKPHLPEPVIKGSFASPEAIAYIMTQKFVTGVPLYRQETGFIREGIVLSRQTMSNWMIAASEAWLTPIYNRLYARLLQESALMADETRLLVITGSERAGPQKGYLWIYRTVKETGFPAVICEYQPGRHGKYPAAFLNGYSGYLQVDGYSGYHGLPDDIIITGCFSHARRLFDEALKIIPIKDRKGTQALRGKRYCDALFAIEETLADMSADERRLWRAEFAKPVMDEYHEWLRSFNLLGKSLFAKAVNYSLNQWQYLRNYLLDGRLEVSNNRTERTAKAYVINRKNFLFCYTQRGADASAVIFSIIQTAIENSLDPYKYLTYIFTNAPNWSITDGPDFVERFLPENVPNYIKAPGRIPRSSAPYDPSIKCNILLYQKGNQEDAREKESGKEDA